MNAVFKLLLGFMALSGLSDVKAFAAVEPAGHNLMGNYCDAVDCDDNSACGPDCMACCERRLEEETFPAKQVKQEAPSTAR